MKIDASLKRLFQRPPNLLLSQSLGEDVVVKRILPTESILVENLHPDMLFELESGELLHAEMHGYWMEEFACRNLIYFGLILRDYQKAPKQVVFWIGRRNVGIADGLRFGEELQYRYRVIDVRDLDARPLLDSPNVNESIFAILCRLDNERAAVVSILRQIADLPAPQQREALVQLLILSGMRGLEPLVRQEAHSMPFEIDVHDNTFLEGIWQEGKQEGRQEGKQEGVHETLLKVFRSTLEQKFGPLPPWARERVDQADAAALETWISRVISSQSLPEVFQ